MVTDTLGDRMKEYYENRSKSYLTRRTPVIIRIDGCHFHTYTKGMEKPFDKMFIKAMQLTTKDLCENIQGCRIAYVESDEISLLLTDYDTHQTDAWFDYSIQKVCSVAASMAALYFNKNWRILTEELEERIFDNWREDEDEIYYKKVAVPKMNLGAYFDARAFNLPESEVVNYFIWRQNDATRNSIQSLGRAHFSQKELHGLNNSQIQDKLHEEKGINWNDCSVVEKRGTCVKRVVNEERSNWIIDTNIPIFTQNRNYIEEVLPKEEV